MLIRGFPGGRVVRIPGCHCGGPKFSGHWGNYNHGAVAREKKLIKTIMRYYFIRTRNKTKPKTETSIGEDAEKLHLHIASGNVGAVALRTI